MDKTQVAEREMMKGTKEKLTIGHWAMPRPGGEVVDFVNVGKLELAGQCAECPEGEYQRRKGGFSLSPVEARELAGLLVEMADIVEGIANEREVA